MTQPNTPRPQLRNIGIGDLRNYALPVPAKVSILHRISGFLLFLFLPLLLWLFEQSLSSETSYDRFLGFAHNFLGRLVLLVLGWGLLHHACAGVRFLLLDLHLGTERAAARQSAWWVLAVSLALTLLLALWIFWPNG
jgi:succinate dehydrogenase / fumarate reductase cytochrome b subunit